MDEIRTLLWEAMRRHWPPEADVTQAVPGNLIVTYRLGTDPARPNRMARQVSVRFVQAVITEMQQSNEARRQEIAQKVQAAVGRRLSDYNPKSEDHDSFIIEIDCQVLDQ